MDRHQLTLIVVTAAITTIINALLVWLGKEAKKRAATEKTRARIKRVFRISNVSVIFNASFLIYFLLQLHHAVEETGPITRPVVFSISFLVGVVIIESLFVFASVIIALYDFHGSK
jgi:threonine/homoserine/homoserine lactone efflux protein